MHKVSREMSYPLFDASATRALEKAVATTLPAHTLMRRAGVASARLALALAPHARRIWVACGPGNNGGDGFEAALQLHQRGKCVTLTWTHHQHDHPKIPDDAHDARLRALAAGLTISDMPPDDFDLGIDALLGIGGTLSPQHTGTALMLDWLHHMEASGAPLLSLDLPTGLDASTGQSNRAVGTHVKARRYTLSLLTLKPGLFTAHGRDLAGEVWFDDLGAGMHGNTALAGDEPVALAQRCAVLQGSNSLRTSPRKGATHASHKGSFGDVVILGGQSLADQPGTSMAGAALLAARAALHAGAGRVFVALVGRPSFNIDPVQPELMFRSPLELAMSQQVVVCGCGGGSAVAAYLPSVLSEARQVVLDADALNEIAHDTALQALLVNRHRLDFETVLTPHPLEAARLLGCSTVSVQTDRLLAARTLAEKFQCTVVLKGSGSIVAAPGQFPVINPTGNALLATAGTGDVLAGMTGAGLAGASPAWQAACRAVWVHGELADEWADGRAGNRHAGNALTASALAALVRP